MTLGTKLPCKARASHPPLLQLEARVGRQKEAKCLRGETLGPIWNIRVRTRAWVFQRNGYLCGQRVVIDWGWIALHLLRMKSLSQFRGYALVCLGVVYKWW